MAPSVPNQPADEDLVEGIGEAAECHALTLDRRLQGHAGLAEARSIAQREVMSHRAPEKIFFAFKGIF
jgi:hypothetical protein